MKTDIVLDCQSKQIKYNFFTRNSEYYAQCGKSVYHIGENKIINRKIAGVPLSISSISTCSEDKLVRPSEMEIGQAAIAD